MLSIPEETTMENVRESLMKQNPEQLKWCDIRTKLLLYNKEGKQESGSRGGLKNLYQVTTNQG